jgi:hypothetical protein
MSDDESAEAGQRTDRIVTAALVTVVVIGMVWWIARARGKTPELMSRFCSDSYALAHSAGDTAAADRRRETRNGRTCAAERQAVSRR